MKVARMIVGSICCVNVADVILYLERKPTSLQLPNNKKKLGSCSELCLDKKTKNGEAILSPRISHDVLMPPPLQCDQ